MKTEKSELKRCILIALQVLTLFWTFTSATLAEEKVKFVMELKNVLEMPVDMSIDENGDIYVLDKIQGKVFVFDEKGNIKFNFGSKSSDKGQLDKPVSIALSNKDVFIVDNAKQKIVVFNKEGKFMYELGSWGKMSGQFTSPTSVAIDQFYNIYVADAENKTITKYSPNGVFLEVKDLDYSPKQIAFDLEQNMYVLYPEVGKIIKYLFNQGKPIEISFTRGDHNYISDTISMAIDKRGDIYLLETKDHSVIKIDQDKKELFSFGSQGTGRGQFDNPSNIDCDKAGRVYLADSKNKRVQIMEITGNNKLDLIAAAYQPPIIDFDGSISAPPTIVDLNKIAGKDLYALAEEESNILVENQATKGMKILTSQLPTPLKVPKAMRVLEDGRILVADTGNNKLQFINPDGSFDYNFGKKGNKNGDFNSLQGIAIDKEGFIYIADTNNNRIQIFNNDGIYLDSFGEVSIISETEKPKDGTFNRPTSLAFNSKEELFVLDNGNRRIQVFDKNGKFIKQIGPSIKQNLALIEPVDIDIDEKDNLYIADKARFSIVVLDSNGDFIIDFGSIGAGPSSFPRLSAITTAQGKIYVSDYDKNIIQVFNFNPQGVKNNNENIVEENKVELKSVTLTEVKEEPKIEAVEAVKEKAQEEPTVKLEPQATINPETRYQIAKYSYPIKDAGETKEKQYAAAREHIIKTALDELSKTLEIAKDKLQSMMKVESEEVMPNGLLKMVLSAPPKIKDKK